jgi:hypothetical protein
MMKITDTSDVSRDWAAMQVRRRELTNVLNFALALVPFAAGMFCQGLGHIIGGAGSWWTLLPAMAFVGAAFGMRWWALRERRRLV